MAFFRPSQYENRTLWPPTGWEDIYELYQEHAAWYSGDPTEISRAFAGKAGSFWGKQVYEERRAMLHVPVAADISQTSAAMLFGEHAKIKVPGASEDDATAKATQARLDDLIEANGLHNVFSDAAEACSALGGVFLKLVWDKSLANRPLIVVAQADCALPVFQFGILTGVKFWKVLETDENSTVWRLVEEYGKGTIITTLWRGTGNELGTELPLNSRADTASIPPYVNTGLDGLACRYVANKRPNRRFRHLYLGQSDYSGLEGVFDSIDEVWSSWMRDIRLGLGRIIAPASFFEKDTDTGTFQFDLTREAYLALNAPIGGDGAKNEITINQFAIRSVEHEQTLTALLKTAYQCAGYSPQTFGLDIQGNAESGTALNIREHKTAITTAKKADYWKSVIEDMLEMMLIIDAQEFGSGITPIRPSVEMQDGIKTDTETVAASVELISRARAASTETLVAMLHPDWERQQREDEVKRILDEQGVNQDPMQVGMV